MWLISTFLLDVKGKIDLQEGFVTKEHVSTAHCRRKIGLFFKEGTEEPYQRPTKQNVTARGWCKNSAGQGSARGRADENVQMQMQIFSCKAQPGPALW